MEKFIDIGKVEKIPLNPQSSYQNSNTSIDRKASRLNYLGKKIAEKILSTSLYKVIILHKSIYIVFFYNESLMRISKKSISSI